MLFSSSSLTALAFVGATLAAPTSSNIHRRETVPHDSLVTLPTKVQTGASGDAILKFNPRLHIASGCQAYAAVDDAGNTSGGLQDTGGATAGCRDAGRGQTYARIGKSTSGATAIMYSFYFPKDQTIDGVSTGSHRHDWEAVVVWIDDPATVAEPTILGGGASGHGEFKITAGALPGGDSPTVEYFSSFPTNHELQFTDTVGVTHEVLDWDAMTDAMRTALQDTDFGSANVPFKDATFVANLDKAALPAAA